MDEFLEIDFVFIIDVDFYFSSLFSCQLLIVDVYHCRGKVIKGHPFRCRLLFLWVILDIKEPYSILVESFGLNLDLVMLKTRRE